MRRAALLFLVSTACFAQKDFLTADEADQLREAQEIPDRLKLYIRFASQRLDLLQQTFAQEKAGRSSLIHDLLEQYTGIIDAIDTVMDDAIRRGKSMEEIPAVADAEKSMLAKLEKWRESAPKDLARYEFALDQAIDTTRDSVEMNMMDLKDRKRDVLEATQKQEKQQQEMSKPVEAVGAKPAAADAAKKSAEQTKPARKAPTLRRKGETVPPVKKQ